MIITCVVIRRLQFLELCIQGEGGRILGPLLDSRVSWLESSQEVTWRLKLHHWPSAPYNNGL
jgi:hypothetical protein